MTELTKADNLDCRVNENGEIVQEPGYIGFLRNEGYTIEEIIESHSVKSESDKSKSYNVLRIVTYAKPKDDPELDYVEDEIEVTVCSCWDYRSNSVDVSEGKRPDGTCKHCRQIFKEKRAKNDENQDTLV